MAGKSSKQQLIELGFKVQTENLEKQLEGSEEAVNRAIDRMLKKVQTFEKAFELINIDPSKLIDGDNFDEVFRNFQKKLTELGKIHSATFKVMQNDVIEYERAIGGALQEVGKIQNGDIIEDQLNASKYAKDPRSYYARNNITDPNAILAAQSARSTMVSSALGGSRTEKELLKEGNVRVLQYDNTKISKFSQENIENLDNYITDTRNSYHEDGILTQTWVDFKIDEYQRLTVSLKRITGQLADGQQFSAFVRAGQTTNNTNPNSEAANQTRLQQQYKQNIDQHIDLLKQKAKISSFASKEEINGIIAVIRSLKEEREQLGVTSESFKRLQNQRLNKARFKTSLNSSAKSEQQQQTKYLNEYNQNLQQQLRLQKELQSASSGDDRTQYIQQELKLLQDRAGELKKSINNTQKLTQAEQDYQRNLADQTSKINDKNDAAAINEAIEARKKLLKAENDIANMKSTGSSGKNYYAEQQREVEKLSQSLRDLENAQLSNGRSVSESSRYQEEANRVTREAIDYQDKLIAKQKDNGISLDNLKRKMGEAVQNIIQYNIAWQAMDRIEDVVMDSVTRIKELDDAITDIRLVTGETHEGARQMINDYADLAAELGTTTDAVIDGSLEWLRQGRTAEETAELLTQSTKLSKLGAIEASDATEKLTA